MQQCLRKVCLGVVAGAKELFMKYAPGTSLAEGLRQYEEHSSKECELSRTHGKGSRDHFEGFLKQLESNRYLVRLAASREAGI